MGDSVVVPRVGSVVGLHALHRLHGVEDEWEAATRLGADRVRLLCVYEQPGDGALSFDVAGVGGVARAG